MNISRGSLSILIMLAGLARAATTPAVPLPTALLDLQASTPALKDRAAQISALLFGGLSTQPEIVLVERAQIDTALGELSLSASGMTDPSSAAKIGRLTGAKVFVMGKAIDVAGDTTVVVKIVGTETGRVFAVTKLFSASSNLTTVANELAEATAKTVHEHAADLVAPAEDAAARDARLRVATAGKKLPTVTVSIPEQHITGPLRDPAAETEIARTLGGLGFGLLDHASAEKAAVRITGEALSEFGLRHGDFISCRARVEIKVVEASTGRILLQDRQTEVVADISEAVAAKTALEHAGAKLAERIVNVLAGFATR